MKVLFCDWNGTLLDDMPIWDEARKKTFLAFGVEPPTIAEYFQELETGDYLEVYRKRGITASREELNAIYEPAYEAQLHRAALFPQIPETLLRLKAQGITLALVTAQQEALVVPLLEKFRIRELFNSVAFHVLDKKALITNVIRDFNIDPRDCYFIGDSPSDIRHAKKSGIISIAFLAGYIPDDLMRAAGAEYYIHTFKEILNLI
jgi:phosphoglycolate phosphatase